MRIDVVDGRTRRWLIEIDKGNLSVTRGGGEADCVARVRKDVFDRIASGRMNAVAAVLRGELEIDGDWRLLVRMQRLFPGPRRRRTAA
jgi:putative sterol carrier protein